jgi:hypothetical protein
MSGTDQLDAMTDHYDSGLRALQDGLYSTAIEELQHAISTGLRDDMPGDDFGSTHFHLAVALLNGHNPAVATAEKIIRIEQHLAMAVECTGTTAALQAHVLSAIVQEDYHRRYGMPAHSVDLVVLDRILARLTADDLWPLLNHIGTPLGAAWQAVCRRVGASITSPRYVDLERAAAVRRYFTPTPAARDRSRSATLFACAALLFVAAWVMFNAASLPLLVGALWLTKSGVDELREYQRYVRRYAAAEPKPSDAEMDAWLDADIAGIAVRVADRVMLNTDLTIQGGDLAHPAQAIVGLPDVAVRAPLKVRRGKDNLLRANSYEVMIVFLTDELFCSYHCQLDFHTGEVTLDQTTEWHYRDIVSVTSSSRPMPAPLVAMLRQQDREFAKDRPLEQIFTLSNTIGDTLSVGTGFSGTADFTGEIAWPNDRTLRVIRRTVRDRHTTA